MATQAEIGRHLDLSQAAVSKFLAEIGTERGHDGYHLDDIRTAYIRRLREQAAGRMGEDTKLNLADERAKLATLQAEMQELKIDQVRGELLPRAQVTSAVQEANARVRARLLALPPRAAPIVAAITAPVEVQAKLLEFVHEALAELAATEVVTGPANGDRPPRGRRSGKGMVAGVRAATETDGKRVGRRKPDAQQRGKRRARKVVDGES